MKTGFYHIHTRASLKDRFEASYVPEPNSGCWLWVGAITTSKGYSRAIISESDVTLYGARVSYELHNGAIPEGALICHRCNNALCVNPEHIYAGTHKTNFDDMVRVGRHRIARIGERMKSRA
jgi:hypothetical protein